MRKPYEAAFEKWYGADPDGTVETDRARRALRKAMWTAYHEGVCEVFRRNFDKLARPVHSK